jgi:Lon protease-like protein
MGQELKTIPLFPLELVVFPGEQLNLHVFENRYKQLLRDVMASDGLFGIPTFMDGKIQEYGTIVRVVKVVNAYADGRADIETIGKEVFKLEETFEPDLNREYMIGRACFLERPDNTNLSERLILYRQAEKLLSLMEIPVGIDAESAQMSYLLGHRVGLSIAQKFDMLALFEERERQQYLLSHLSRALPILKELENARVKIRQNGHFKNIPPINF